MSTVRAAIVTGCGRENGLGYAISAQLARQGMQVLMTDIDPRPARNADEPDADYMASAGLDTLVGKLRDEGNSVHAAYGDLADPDGPGLLVQRAVELFGRVDVLVNNAAAPQGADRNAIEDVPEDAVAKLVSINLLGTFRMCQAVVPQLRKQTAGRIVNISSIHGKKGTSNTALYSMTKAGIDGLTRALAIELGPAGITVNSVAPGFVHTSRSESSRRRAGVADVEAWLAVGDAIPIGRRATTTDIAPVVGFLAGETSGYITAQSLTVDGGFLGW
ncbi:SDR family NAD(P)-dependent oxidoreductase [Amycolatopsis thermoflava]